MDDALKLQKLAAARSKLKSHQQKKQKKPESNASDTRSVDSTTSSNGSEHPSAPKTNASPVPQIQSYFTSSAPVSTPNVSSTAMYFDNVPMEGSTTSSTNQNMPLSNIDEKHYAPSNITDDVISYEDPEINPNLVYEFAQKNQQNVSPNPSTADLSMTEQVRQLNEQLSHTIDAHSNGYENYSNYSDLEKRNLELASSFEKEKLQVEQLNAILQEYKNHISQLERQMELLRVECENKVRNDLAPLENEISTHRQTLGILVGEKTELSATLNHTQMMLKHKTTECEELQARLKTSRSRVADFERELTSLKEERGRHAQMQNGHNQEFQKIQNELHTLKASKNEAEHDLSEMRERLKKSQENNTQLMQTCHEYEGKLELANVKIQQLTAGTDSTESERFMQERQMLEKQILDLNSSLKNALSERDQTGTQYQQYVQQLNGNITNLAEKLDASTAENENLIKRENELVQHISELEKRLQNLQQESIATIYKQPPRNGNGGDADVEHKEPGPNVEVLQAQKKEYEERLSDMQSKFDAVCSERDEFIKDVEAKKYTIEELEAMIERLKGNQTNSTQMLADIESEKVAASRAVEQNIKLKQQLEEMQEAFIRMTNDKAELTTQLSSEQFRFKELEDQHTLVAHQMHTLSEAIAIKDRELTQMREKAEEADKHVDEHVCKQDQLHDRLRHYEAHENSANALTHELQHAKESMQLLTQKNKLLEAQLQAEKATIECNSHEDHEKSSVEEQTVAEEETKLVAQLVTQSIQTEAETVPSGVVESHPIASTPLEMPTSREIAMRQLETKFMRTMQDIANLQDEKQCLEHLVLQLQGETETIGEYIALYQHQRGVLKQRAIEKETQLKQLATDREHMKLQLHMLNELIKRLLSENKISDGVLEEQREINANASALCEEHAKLHKAMRDNDEFVPGSQEETAQQIMALLGEIKTSNLVQPTDVTENFHPCPLCSGQLITV